MKEDEKHFLQIVYQRGTRLEGVEIIRGEPIRDIINEVPINYKRCWYLLGKWADKGWYEYGVTLDLGWLTSEGVSVVAELAIEIKGDESWHGMKS